jgi:hypothetical protein
MIERGEFLVKNRLRIVKMYEKRMKHVPDIRCETEQKLAACQADAALAIMYLYAVMPYSDMGNYPFETFLDYAAHGVFLWHTCEGVRKLPEEIFLNYVLYHRVNEEEITPCRSFFYEQIKGRIAGMDREKQAVEINYWCAQEVTYQCTDDRTLSAMAVYNRGNGRCGEESTFAVNVLRSAGIPARQVYAPKWSHCDDNHAWVEILNGEKWCFFGACEPAEILNTGWFTRAASRAMMIHSRLFDEPGEQQEVIGNEGMVTALNELGRYARVKEITVVVRDESGQPVQGVVVCFEVINYSEYAPIAKCTTNEEGRLYLTTGLGSLHIHAARDGRFADSWIDTRRLDQCELVLKEPAVKEEWTSYDMIAPADDPVNMTAPTKEQKSTARERLLEAAALRKVKTEGWCNPERQKFLTGKDHTEYRQKILEVLTEKDQTDLKSEVLEEHLKYGVLYEKQFPEEIFVPYILNPRVEDEVLQEYRTIIDETFSEAEKENLRRDPRKIWNVIEQRMKSCPSGEKDALVTVPGACMRLGIASRKSQEILFVAIARTLGIPARLNQTDRAMEYFEENKFVPVLPETGPNCTLILKAGNGVTWNYFQNWSIARLVGGAYESLRLSDELWENGILTQKLEAGSYRILTSNRLPSGNIFANQYKFVITAGQKTEVELRLRSAGLEDMLLNITLPEFTLSREDGSEASKAALMGKEKHILMFLEESEEPTEHVLNEMLELKEAFAEYSHRIIFVVRSSEALADPTISKVLKTFGNIQICYDSFEENLELLGRRMYVNFEQLPMIIVTDEEQNGIYAASGYNVGTGNMLLRLM